MPYCERMKVICKAKLLRNVLLRNTLHDFCFMMLDYREMLVYRIDRICQVYPIEIKCEQYSFPNSHTINMNAIALFNPTCNKY